LENMAYLHRDHGDAEGVRLIAERLLKSGEKSMPEGLVKSTAAEIYANLGDYDHASQVADSLADQTIASDVRERIRGRQEPEASPEQDAASDGESEDPYSRANALLEVARKQSSSGDSASASDTLFQAFAAAGEIAKDSAATMIQIAIAWAEAGNKPQARQTLEEALQRDHEESGGLRADEVASALAGMGDFDRALEIARDMDPVIGSSLYGEIASAQAKAGQIQQVLEWVSSLKSPQAKAEVLLNICDVLSPEDLSPEE
jgi:tetratricopeptide (TPR) repeat protein